MEKITPIMTRNPEVEEIAHGGALAPRRGSVYRQLSVLCTGISSRTDYLG